MKFISKLIRLDEQTVKDINKIKNEISKTEYITFTALLRKLVRIGIKNYKNEI